MEAKQKIQIMVTHYLLCADWADSPEDSLEWTSEFSDDAKVKAFEDCQQLFLNIQLCQTNVGDSQYQSINLSSEKTLEQLGHDLWLTRNNNGAGFWDGKPEFWSDEDGEKLTEYTHKNFCELSLWLNDDTQVEFE